MERSIPREFSLKKAVLSGIGWFASLMMLLALCYSLVVREFYYGYFSARTISECGFTMLKFSSILITSSYQWGAIVIGLFCLLQLLLSLAMIVGNILAFLLAPKKINTVVATGSVIANVCFSFLYMLEGIIFTTICNETMSGGFITFAYIPFIFAILITVAYFVCFVVIKEKDGGQFGKAMYPTYGAYGFDPTTGQPIAPQANPMYGAYAYDPMTGQPIAPQSADETDAEGEGEDAQDQMSPERVNMLLMNFRNFIPEERIPAFRYALGKARANCYTSLSMVPLKNPTTVLLFSIFLGGWGVDRFYIGDTGMGVAKLLVGWLTLGIWSLVDIFMCYKKVKEQNFALLMSALQNTAY